MKATILSLASCFAALVVAGPCPFAEMKDAGVLSTEDAAKFEMVKRDPEAAERLLFAHRQKYKRSIDEAAAIAPRQNSSSGLLGILPLGGGLRKTAHLFNLF